MKREHQDKIKMVAHHHDEVKKLIAALKPIFGRDVFDGRLFGAVFDILRDYRRAVSEAVGDHEHWLGAYLVGGCHGGTINGQSVAINTLDDLCRVIDMQKEADHAE